MLINFRVENFKSFKNYTEFSMLATKLKNLKLSNTFNINTISLLTSAVIYGANASGKSSVLNSIETMISIIKNSIDIDKSKHYKALPFLLNKDTENKPSIFEIEFIIGEIIYRYGFEINIDSTILKEWLDRKKLKKRSRFVSLFKRNQEKISINLNFKEGNNIFPKTRKNALFLTVVAQFNGKISAEILNWINKIKILSNIKSEMFEHYSFAKLDDKKFKEKIISLVKGADIGVHDIIKEKDSNFDQIKKEGMSSIKTKHIQYTNDQSFHKIKTFDLGLESEGTKKLFALAAPILDSLENGEILIIDELDNSLHTLLAKAIIALFNSAEKNKNHAQLIFTTHDTNLLDQKIFRRDQIWFTQKNILGESDLYSLVEYGKGKARDDLSLEKNYLKGKFGSIPHINSLSYEADNGELF